ncbi:MAG TPA: OmpH family outer membrane protein [Chryseolinea sp.]|nr:OmpH family outer membrane protein [Chryseolinea sp.]
MRPCFITIFFLIFGLNFVQAQRFGYIDTDFILSKIPEYRKAQDEINGLSEAWEKEIQESQKKIDAMYSALQAEQVLLTEEMKKERTDVIKKKESELKEYQKKVFGFGGLFFLKKQELMKPIQDKVWDASEKVCKENNLAIMFDKSGAMVMIYTDPRHDYTDFVLDQLGYGDPNDKIKN